ncbi:unnamed protein product, partial [Rotaria sp. Silwood2]
MGSLTGSTKKLF